MSEDAGGYLYSEAEQYEAFKATAPGVPILMVNLIRFHALARYPAGHPDAGAGRSGAQAFAIYRREVAPIIARVGGRQSLSAVDGLTLIGPPRERWDWFAVNEYPGVEAFLALMRDPGYRAASVHRAAAIADTRTIRCLPAR
ncbi:MAG: DUF1330 domain-containing protein [Gammaproteobacteria bacterium]